jgi:PAS domain S-box-containing protein
MTDAQTERFKDRLSGIEAENRRLKENEQRWRGIFERLHEGFLLAEAVRDETGRMVDWRYLDVNPGWEALVGIPREQAVGRTVREAIPGIEPEWVSAFVPVIENGESVSFVRDVGKLGRSYEVRAFPVEKDRFAVLFLEVTGKKRVEEQLKESLRERERAWTVSQDLLAVTNLDGRIERINPAWTAVLGWSEDELRRMPFLHLVHPDDRAKTHSEFERLRQGVRTPRFANRYRSKSGAYRWLSWTAVLDGGVLHSVARDITDVRQAAESLERSEARLRAITETSHLYQGLLDPNGLVLHANATALKGIAAHVEDIAGKPFWETPWFAGTPGMTEIVRDACLAAAKGETVRKEMALNLPIGQRFFDFVIRPIRNKEGAVTAIVPEAADVTERRQNEDALRQSHKMEAVGQLTGGLAHDFNNLLTGIIGCLELLDVRLRQGRTGDLDRYIVAAREASKRAASLTHRLLAFSRRQTLDPKPTAVNGLVAGMEDLIRHSVGQKILVEIAEADGLWPVLVDQNQLENALLNLCINARDAMPDGGLLKIETANRRMDEPHASEHELAPGPYLCLCVSDTGTGMTPEVMARAFDPFFTTKPLGMGTGLGLSMTYGFVRQSGGQVRISSEVGKGTAVCLYLPRYRDPSNGHGHASETPAAQEAPRAKPGETVLVVEDEAMIRILIVEVLTGLGYGAIEAAGAQAGLDILKSGKKIDLLVTDVGLPGSMNGSELADAGRALCPDLKVLFITGYAQNEAAIRGHLDRGMYMVAKPFTMETLTSRIREIIALI